MTYRQPSTVCFFDPMHQEHAIAKKIHHQCIRLCPFQPAFSVYHSPPKIPVFRLFRLQCDPFFERVSKHLDLDLQPQHALDLPQLDHQGIV